MNLSARTDLNKWIVEVEEKMIAQFALGIDGAGLDEAQLYKHFISGETPVDFVEWLGRKYDLEERRELSGHVGR